MVRTIENLKTIRLYGRGTKRYRIFPRVWQESLRQAREDKAWAESILDVEAWNARVSIMSQQMLQDRLTKSIYELALETYRYWELRAHLGNPECWDRPARQRWIEFGGKIRPRRKKAVYGDKTTSQRNWS